jgi:hypothetical protein
LHDSPRSVSGLLKYRFIAGVTTVLTIFGASGLTGINSALGFGFKLLTTNFIFFVVALSRILRFILSTTTFFGILNKFVIS